MANSYRILAQYLEACQQSPDLGDPLLQTFPLSGIVPGETPALKPPVEMATNLTRFARGELNESQILDMCHLLDKNPEWISWLSHHIKELRQPMMERE